MRSLSMFMFRRGLASGRTDLAAAVIQRDWLMATLLAIWAGIFGVIVASQPKLAVAAIGITALVVLALNAPLTVLVAYLALTAVIPYSVEHAFSIGGGSGPGLSPSDGLIAAGLLRAVLTLPHMRLDRRRLLAAVIVTLFAAIVLFQCVRGMRSGESLSVVATEARRLLGFTVLLIAIPLLEDERARKRLLSWMLALGLGLGVWGLVQWFGGFSFGVGIGVRSGVAFTSAASGSLQGGLFVYPIAIVLTVAALMSGQVQRRWLRILLLAVLVTNVADLILTYERTVWIGTTVGILFLLLRADRSARQRGLIWIPVAAAVGLSTIAMISPKTIVAAEQRLFSIGQYSSDTSVRYRLIESRHVLARIEAHPVTGSGLGATVFWGRPYDRVPPGNYNYTHVGFLWLAWKLGIPGAALLVGLMLCGIFWRGPPDAEPLFVAFRTGAQAVLLTLLVMAVTFPVFNSLEVPGVAGLLLAVCAMPRRGPVRRA